MKKHNFFKTLFILVFLLFLALFIASKTGYYEKSVKDKTYLTNKMPKILLISIFIKIKPI